MDELTEAVVLANANFYRALSLADFGAMQRVWLASPDAVCVHPGWPPLRGWPDIRESWRGICEIGFDRCILPQSNLKRLPDVEGIRITGVRSVSEAVEALFWRIDFSKSTVVYNPIFEILYRFKSLN